MGQGPGLPATSYAVLGLLSFRPELTGYQVKQWADSTLRFYWVAPAMSQIYAELARLEAAELVRARDERGPGRRSSRRFSITEAGTACLREWLREPAQDFPVLKHPVALRLLLGHLADDGVVRGLLDGYLDALSGRRGDLAAVRAGLGDPPDLPYPALVADWGLQYYDAEEQIVRRLLDRLPAHDAARTATPRRPVLIACSHGTRDPQGQAALAALTDAVRAARPGMAVRSAFVDVQQPSPAEVVADVAAGGDQAVVVPLLLSGGYHVRVDIAKAVAQQPGRVVATAPLGPDDALLHLLEARLREAGVGDGHAVVLAAAGSTEPAAQADVAFVAGTLGRRLGRPVPVGYVAGEPDLIDVVRSVRDSTAGPVALATYLLAPGAFATRLRQVEADLVAAPLIPDGGHVDRALVRLVLRRYDAAAGNAAFGGAG